MLPYTLFKRKLQNNDCFKQYLQYKTSLTKLDNCQLRISFLEKCRDSDIIPKFLLFKIPSNGCFDQTSVHNFQNGLLVKEIGKAKVTFLECQVRLEEKRRILRVKVPYILLPSVVWYSRGERRRNRKTVESKHEKKLKYLSLLQEKPLFNVINTVKTYDVDVPIPNYVLQTLSMGPRSPVLDKFNEKDVLSELDSFLNFCKGKPVPDSILTDLNIKTLNYIKTCKKQTNPKNVKLTQQFLTKNNLLAVPYDKGIGFCIMPKTTYEKKLNPIINLPQFQKHVEKRMNAKSPVLKEEERVCQALTKLKKEGKISNSLFDELKPVGSQPPRLYGLAKVHKKDTPLRPIVSMPGSAYNKIAKNISFWFSFVSECNIQTSSEKVANKLRNISLAKDETLLSFDVTSLYTNVPVHESIEYCADLLFDKRKIIIKDMDKQTFITLAKLACCDVVFLTHDGYYTQNDGLAMGSPPAPHLANGWLSRFDDMIKGDSKLYERYMDDILCSAKCDSVSTRLNYVNNLHPCLDFTYELENDKKSIAFLDMLIKNENGNLSSQWYRKPTDTGLTLNYHALAPLKYKRSVVASFVHRIFRSCSSWENFHKGLDEALSILENNQYPSTFVLPIVNKTLTKLISPDDESLINDNVNLDVDLNACLFNMDDKDKFMFFIQYRGKATEKLAMSFKRLNAPCKVVMTTRKLKTVMPSLKPIVPKMLSSGVVYKIQCPGCTSSYIGQTVRHLQTRFREHLGCNGTMRRHTETCDPSVKISEDSISILARANKYFKLLTLEALFINEIKPDLNTKDEYRSRTLTLKF